MVANNGRHEHDTLRHKGSKIVYSHCHVMHVQILHVQILWVTVGMSDKYVVMEKCYNDKELLIQSGVVSRFFK